MSEFAGIAAWKFNLKAEIHSYDDALTFLDDAVDRDLGPQMYAKRINTGPCVSYIAVVLYQTDIIRYYPNGMFSVDNGGHASPTTRERLQAVVPDGFIVAHHRKQLGLFPPGARGHMDKAGIWPLDHSKIIDPATGTLTKEN